MSRNHHGFPPAAANIPGGLEGLATNYAHRRLNLGTAFAGQKGQKQGLGLSGAVPWGVLSDFFYSDRSVELSG
jgi:hypothetical protein